MNADKPDMGEDSACGLAEPWNRLSLNSLSESSAAAFGKRLFLSDGPRRQQWDGETPRQLSFSAFRAQGQFFAAQLHTMGISAGEHVVLLLPNTVDYAIALLGASILGAVPAIVAVDETADGLRGAIERCQAVAIITTERIGTIKLAERARAAAAKVMSVRCVAAFGLDVPDGVIPLDGWSVEDLEPFTAPTNLDQNRDALVTFTRDVTGICASFWRESQLVAETLALAHAFRVDGHATMLDVMQPGSVASVVAGLMLPLMVGAQVKLSGPFETDAFLTLLGENPDVFVFGPVHLLEEIERATQSDTGQAMVPPIAGYLALAHLERASLAPMIHALPKISEIRAIPFLSLGEAAMLSMSRWPEDGMLALTGAMSHPIPNVLPGGRDYLRFDVIETGHVTPKGFGAARQKRRTSGIMIDKVA